MALPFLLSTKSCPKDALELTISIAKKDNGIFSDFCKLFLYSNGSCVSFRGENCKCEEEKGSYSLTKTIDMSDETVWRWRTSNENIASDKTIEFIVHCECVCVCVRACVRACVHACVRVDGRACVCVWSGEDGGAYVRV